jgi:hypothetical protein
MLTRMKQPAVICVGLAVDLPSLRIVAILGDQPPCVVAVTSLSLRPHSRSIAREARSKIRHQDYLGHHIDLPVGASKKPHDSKRQRAKSFGSRTCFNDTIGAPREIKHSALTQNNIWYLRKSVKYQF